MTPPDNRRERVAHGHRVDAGKVAGLRRQHLGICIKCERKSNVVCTDGRAIMPACARIYRECNGQRVSRPHPARGELWTKVLIADGFNRRHRLSQRIEYQIDGLLALRRAYQRRNKRVCIRGCRDRQDGRMITVLRARVLVCACASAHARNDLGQMTQGIRDVHAGFASTDGGGNQCIGTRSIGTPSNRHAAGINEPFVTRGVGIQTSSL